MDVAGSRSIRVIFRAYHAPARRSISFVTDVVCATRLGANCFSVHCAMKDTHIGERNLIMANLGFSLSPMSGIPFPEFFELSRAAEDAGMSGIFVPEANNDALMCCYGIARGTKRVQIGTWIVNIYLREPTLCSAAAEMIQDAADGRFILGLGVSHRPALEARGIDMGNARDRLRRDTVDDSRHLTARTEMFGMKFRQPKKPIPIYYAALALETARLGGELADGLMLYLCTPERMRKSIDAAREIAIANKAQAFRYCHDRRACRSSCTTT